MFRFLYLEVTTMRFSVLGGAALAVAAAAALWSCGGGSSNPTSPSNTTSPGATPSSATVNIMGQLGAQSFSPNPAAVNQGGMVVWHNGDSVTHHIVLNDGSLDTGNIAPGASSAALQLAVNGANYHCAIHPTMVGSINAATGTPPPCQGPYC
jgi:plastocyanin